MSRRYPRKNVLKVRRRKRHSKCLPHQLRRLIPNLEVVKEDLCLRRGIRTFIVPRWGDVSMSTVVVERCSQGRKDPVVKGAFVDGSNGHLVASNGHLDRMAIWKKFARLADVPMAISKWAKWPSCQLPISPIDWLIFSLPYHTPPAPGLLPHLFHRRISHKARPPTRSTSGLQRYT